MLFVTLLMVCFVLVCFLKGSFSLNTSFYTCKILTNFQPINLKNAAGKDESALDKLYPQKIFEIFIQILRSCYSALGPCEVYLRAQ